VPDSLARGAPVATVSRPTPIVLVEKAKPPITSLSVRGFAVCDYGDLDRAGNWVDCLHGPGCPNRAYLIELHSTEEGALASIDQRGKALSRKTLPTRPRVLTREEPLHFTIWDLEAVDVRGRDYRPDGCMIPRAREQLRHGSGQERAWLEIQRQRDHEQVEGALLPRPAGASELFLFVTAAAERIRRREKVLDVAWRADGDARVTRC
jgi:hypothetical protein